MESSEKRFDSKRLRVAPKSVRLSTMDDYVTGRHSCSIGLGMFEPATMLHGASIRGAESEKC